MSDQSIYTYVYLMMKRTKKETKTIIPSNIQELILPPQANTKTSTQTQIHCLFFL